MKKATNLNLTKPHKKSGHTFSQNCATYGYIWVHVYKYDHIQCSNNSWLNIAEDIQVLLRIINRLRVDVTFAFHCNLKTLM